MATGAADSHDCRYIHRVILIDCLSARAHRRERNKTGKKEKQSAHGSYSAHSPERVFATLGLEVAGLTDIRRDPRRVTKRSAMTVVVREQHSLGDGGGVVAPDRSLSNARSHVPRVLSDRRGVVAPDGCLGDVCDRSVASRLSDGGRIVA
jgi:hypothetical protein